MQMLISPCNVMASRTPCALLEMLQHCMPVSKSILQALHVYSVSIVRGVQVTKAFAETQLVVSGATATLLAVGRFAALPYQRRTAESQMPTQNGETHAAAGDSYVLYAFLPADCTTGLRTRASVIRLLLEGWLVDVSSVTGLLMFVKYFELGQAAACSLHPISFSFAELLHFVEHSLRPKRFKLFCEHASRCHSVFQVSESRSAAGSCRRCFHVTAELRHGKILTLGAVQIGRGGNFRSADQRPCWLQRCRPPCVGIPGPRSRVPAAGMPVPHHQAHPLLSDQASRGHSRRNDV